MNRFFGCFILISLTQLSFYAEKPNFIIIMVDDMGYGGPSCYGGTTHKTPGIDQLSKEGMRFTDFHSSGVVCSPTRAGLLTGRYQQRAGIEAVIHPVPGHPENLKGLQTSETTFAELLQDHGYRTGLVGKWHLGYDPKYHPMNHGFQKFIGFIGGNDDYISHYGDHLVHDWFHGKVETKEEGYITHLINDYSLKFIEHHKDQPFCLYIAHESPHSPNQGPGDPIQRGPKQGQRNTAYPLSKSTDEAISTMIKIMDEGVVQIRDKVIELGLDKNTYIVFLSDNGGTSKNGTNHQNLRGGKGSPYEGGHRVPAIFWHPQKIKKNSINHTLAISLDIMPTLLSLSGTDYLGELDGIDLTSAIHNHTQEFSRDLYWMNLSNSGIRSEAMRSGAWKLVVTHPKPDQSHLALYHLEQDLREQKDLSERYPEKVKAMHAQLKKASKTFTKSATPQLGGWHRQHNWNKDSFNHFRIEKQKLWNAGQE